MARMNSVLAVLVVAGAVMMMAAGSASATDHVVGSEELGWDVPPNVTFFEDWANARTFCIGDKLIFQYRPGSNNIFRVSKQDYEACDANSALEAYFLGPTTLTLTAPGDYYYFSTFGKHCEFGQRLHVKVVDGKCSSSNQNTRKLQEVSSTPSPASAPASAPAPGPASGVPLTTDLGTATVAFGVAASLLAFFMM